MKILILNQHTNNFGDDAAGIALIYQLFEVFPDSTIDIVYSWNNNKSSLPTIDSRVQHHLDICLSRTIRDIGKVLVQVIGSNLSSNYEINGSVGEIARLARNANIVIVSPCGANIGIYKDWLFLARILIAIAVGSTPIFHLNTVGKSNSFLFNILSRYALKKSKLYVREMASFEYLKQLGIHSVRGVDTAFSLPEISTSDSKCNLSSKYVTFIPTELSNWHIHYRGSNIDSEIMTIICKSIASFCKSKNLLLVLLPHLNGSYREQDLLLKCKDLLTANGLDELTIKIADDVKNVFHYEQYIHASEFVVSMRYHGVILAIKNCVPYISLSYENKMKEACSYSGMPQYNIDVKEITNIDLLVLLDKLNKNKNDIKKELTLRKPFLTYLSKLPIHNIWLDSNSLIVDAQRGHP